MLSTPAALSSSRERGSVFDCSPSPGKREDDPASSWSPRQVSLLLPPLPLRLALLGKGPRPLDPVLGVLEPLALRVGHPERDVERQAQPLVGRLLARAN